MGQTELIGEMGGVIMVVVVVEAAAEVGALLGILMVVVPMALVLVIVLILLVLAYLEWQEGVLRAERPAQRAICKSGRWGREKSAWWVSTKRSPR